MRGYDVGGAIVRRRLTGGPDGLPMLPGDVMSADAVMALTEHMRRVLVDQKTIEVFYVHPGASDGGPSAGGERFSVHVGKGEYIVVQGRRITEKVVSRAEAEAIVAGGLPKVDDEL